VNDTPKIPVAVLISGRGSNLQSLIDASQAASFPAQIVLVISNVEGAGGLARASAAGIATRVISHKNSAGETKPREAFDAEIDAVLRAAQIEIVCLAGFMRILSDGFTRAWEGRLLNIHPSLLPAYKGTRVHERVIAAGEKQSGASVHFVVPELDAGPVISHSTVPVLAHDTPETLAARVLEAEHRLYPTALRLVAEKRVTLVNGASAVA
jgi:phosphoribosylglycinamide formyltransferase-1